MPELNEGDRAPGFDLPANGGGRVALSELQGKAVVLYFYPRDDTPGCTSEAIAFSGLKDAFATANAVVVGVSKDTAASHDKFAAKHDLAVRLLSDESGAVTEAYGAWVEKSMYGKKYMGIDRSTVLIDANGVVRRIWRKVKVAGHAESVLDAVRSLNVPT